MTRLDWPRCWPSFVRWTRAQMSTAADILFIGNVGEEGPGDLRGVKYLFREGPYRDRIARFVSVESGGQTTITNGALGSKRYRVTFTGPGGHSYGAFGLVNPAFAMAGAITRFAAIAVPEDPKTTLSVGLVRGGTSVNSIPFQTSMDVDMRSVSPAELDKLVEAFLSAMDLAVDEENALRSVSEGPVVLSMELIGDRPSGLTPARAPLVQAALAAARAFGIEPTLRTSSTDANLADQPWHSGDHELGAAVSAAGAIHSTSGSTSSASRPSAVSRFLLTTVLAAAGFAP